jgi:hypothetical protein
MPRKLFVSMVVAGVAAAGCQTMNGQMVVHAVSGIVKAIHPAQHSLDLDIEDGSPGSFETASKSSVALSFDKDLRGDAVDASTFQGVGSFVVVYYYGFGSDRTAVAIKDLGKGPFEKVTGSVTEFDKHNHTLTVHTDKGDNEQFQLSEKAVVDTGMSLESGQKYDPHKGYTVRVTAEKTNGEEVAVFVRSRD